MFFWLPYNLHGMKNCWKNFKVDFLKTRFYSLNSNPLNRKLSKFSTIIRVQIAHWGRNIKFETNCNSLQVYSSLTTGKLERFDQTLFSRNINLRSNFVQYFIYTENIIFLKNNIFGALWFSFLTQIKIK